MIYSLTMVVQIYQNYSEKNYILRKSIYVFNKKLYEKSYFVKKISFCIKNHYLHKKIHFCKNKIILQKRKMNKQIKAKQN